MAEYRKKPVVIEAVLNDGTWPPIIAWLDSLVPEGELTIPMFSRPPVTRNPEDGTLNIETLEGTMLANVGDWIIQGVKGELYPIKDSIFQETYEAVE